MVKKIGHYFKKEPEIDSYGFFGHCERCGDMDETVVCYYDGVDSWCLDCAVEDDLVSEEEAQEQRSLL